MKGRNKKGLNILSFLITAIIAGISYYLFLPAVNIKNEEFWLWIAGVFFVYAAAYYLRTIPVKSRRYPVSKVPAFVLLAAVIIPLVVGFFGSTRLFHAGAYSRILTVSDGSIDDIPSVDRTSSIALMDTASAQKLGNREIGSLSNVVSQYNVSEYTQIDNKGVPVKISPLRYDGFFKWNRNKSSGIPGYVLVNPVSMDADYVSLQDGLRYVPSAYFSENLKRHIRFAYPTAMFGNLHFEIDEEGHPWYIASVYEHRIGLFGGTQVSGIILVNPVSGEMQKLKLEEIPGWVDVVYPGDLICEQYNDYAQLHDGFLNSVFGQSGCRKVTEYISDNEDEEQSSYMDYGYVSKDGDIWIYTGITSVNNDSSNIGFILSNERTEETVFISCSGADEFSAMASAEGEVQEKGYQASFPSLILVNDKPAYIMVLKDASGLVKMYACVNVEQYNMVATAGSQKECISRYEALLKGRISQEEATAENSAAESEAADILDTSGYKEKEITIRKMQTIDRNGNTYLYIADEDGTIYHALYTDVIDLMLAEEGDRLEILTDGENFMLMK